MTDPSIVIAAITTRVPSFSYTPAETLSAINTWAKDLPPHDLRRIINIFENTPIKNRHSIIGFEQLFRLRSISQMAQAYEKNAIEHGTAILHDLMEQNQILPKEIDYLITTSCTGFMIPSFDAYLIENLGLKKNTRRLPITEVGCSAGAASLLYAHDLLRGNPHKIVAIINLEFPSNTFQLQDFSLENVVAMALFADGISASLVCSKETMKKRQMSLPRGYLEIIDTDMCQIPRSTEILGYHLVDTGLKMNLDRTLPMLIAEHWPQIVGDFLDRNNLGFKDVGHYLLHPGGTKIIDTIEDKLISYGKNLRETREIMMSYGNLSSATLGFITQHYLSHTDHQEGDLALLMAFGPGFTAHQLLTRWRPSNEDNKS